jgi:predicted NUDIX family NTP pyrophosphohydrolase
MPKQSAGLLMDSKRHGQVEGFLVHAWAVEGNCARRTGVSKGTLQNREQDRGHPRGPAKALLRVFEKDPDAVLRTLV